jgi:hypothetical protein
MELFHGGCHGCTMQTKKGISYCVGCQYFDADWSLPDLNDEHKREEKRINIIKDKARAEAKTKPWYKV